jgi:NADH-quinone oxidoreductase subunit L
LQSGGIDFRIGFLIDPLTAIMLVVVTSVSAAVHVYTIGYMQDDPGYTRFFSYISLFTFSMLMLVMSNNFLQLFFGWEAVGLVSYLLIGFWYHRETAIFANLKAFLVNRVGDFGFILGIAAVVMVFGTLDYWQVFDQVETVHANGVSFEFFAGHEWSAITVICLLLFVGAMGKSAQFPLHVWLPDSMEGPTPISALIHAATMVTAGVFMVARMSPMFELSDVALSFILVIGAITALFMGLLGVVQTDIKKVIAYSTLSQLGYMMVAIGASAYAAGMFHLMTHAFFKALLFLAAGSVIIAMHHEQDMRKMGGLRKYLPITHWTSLIGTLALIGMPFFAGFYSKDSIIEAVKASHNAAAPIAYLAVLLGVFITALYSFRLYFMVFWGKERMDEHTRAHLHESPWTVTVPLIFLAVPSVVLGGFMIEPMLFGNLFSANGTAHSPIVVYPGHDVLGELGEHYHGVLAFTWHGVQGLPFWLMLAGIATAWYLYMLRTDIPAQLVERYRPLHTLLTKKYYFDEIYYGLFAMGSRIVGWTLWQIGDVRLIDGLFVNGSAKVVGAVSAVVRHVQSGYLYHYAFGMIIGLLLLLSLVLIG